MVAHEQSRVAVIGSGAVGGFLAGEFSAAGHRVMLCVRTPLPRLAITSKDQRREVPVEIMTDPHGIAPVRWLVLATKAQDTPGAASWLSQLANQDTTIIIAQNGADHAARVAPFAPKAAVLPALVYVAAERVAPGEIVHHLGSQLTVPAGVQADALAQLAQGSTLKIEPEADFLTASWRKLLGNLSANPITALTLQRIGVMHDPDIRKFALGVLTEGAAVARAEGAKLHPDEAEQIVTDLMSYNPNGGSSMLYDRLAGRPLEHEFITGAVVSAAARHGIAVPLNEALLALLRALDRSMRAEAKA
jgi:2-dehydropantoate 2-reductase